MSRHVVAVTGGRDYGNYDKIASVLQLIHLEDPITVLVHGGCDGADKLAEHWAIVACVQTCEFRVTNVQWTKLGKSAGPTRNRLMLETTSPRLLVAFPGGTGTASCVRIARELGIKVLGVT